MLLSTHSTYTVLAVLVGFASAASVQLATTNNVEASRNLGRGIMQTQACYNGPKQSGCDNGYCWRRCGDGPWCWTALNEGYGDWIQCAQDSDCSNQSDSCSVGGDDKSGCSC